MSSPDFPPPPRAPRAPRFVAASWIVLIGGLAITFVVFQVAVALRRPGEWLPGIGEALLGILLTGLGAFGCGLTALLRRERRWWLALIPFLAGQGTMLYFGWNLITKR